MKKTIILTESELVGVIERIINEQMSSSPKGEETKKFQQLFNKIYKTRFPIDGNWKDKTYNSTMMRYIKDKGLSMYVCKKGDGYCSDAQEGEVHVRGNDIKKLRDFMMLDFGDGPKDVKKFQDWLDRYYPTWLKGKKLNRGRGYGTFGPYTKEAWGKYKNEYKEF